MTRALGRVIMVPLAFILAALTTLFVIFSLGQERIVQAMTGRGPDEATFGAAFDLLGLALALVSIQTLLPALHPLPGAPWRASAGFPTSAVRRPP